MQNGLYNVPSWLSPVERLAVNQSVKGPNPFDGATPNGKKLPVSFSGSFSFNTNLDFLKAYFLLARDNAALLAWAQKLSFYFTEKEITS